MASHSLSHGLAKEKRLRFGDFLREVTIQQNKINFNDLAPKIKKDSRGKPLPWRSAREKLRNVDVYNLLQPYVSIRFIDQLKAVVPLAIYLVLFQLFILGQGVEGPMQIGAGLLAVIVGLMFFMEGLKLGLMPFGETIGHHLPTKSPLWGVLLVTFLLGIGVTFAEPAIGALKTAGSIVDVRKAPYLYTLLNDWADTLVLVVGLGVGVAAILGTLRFIYGWSLKPMIYLTLIPTLGVTAYMMSSPDLAKVLGLAWDCGAVTTGPVTVPLVLSLGIGVAAAAGKGENTLSGFGIVTLASVFPILAVLGLTLYVSQTVEPSAIIAQAESLSIQTAENSGFWDQTPGLEIRLGLQAIIPLVLFLLLVLKIALRQKIQNAGIIAYGIFLTVLGMIIFNLGLTYGLSQLGNQSGSLVPAAFTQIDAVAESPIYFYALGITIAFLFAWFLGFGATLAEPALNALGYTVQNLTNGAFKKSLLMYSVSFGVAFGLGIGVLKIVYNIPIGALLIPLYSLGLILTFFSTEEFVNVSWDSAGVTTGPVTVPLVLAMGLGFGGAVNALEGFGVLAMASICPILSVLTCGIFIQHRINRKQKRDTQLANQGGTP